MYQSLFQWHFPISNTCSDFICCKEHRIIVKLQWLLFDCKWSLSATALYRTPLRNKYLSDTRALTSHLDLWLSLGEFWRPLKQVCLPLPICKMCLVMPFVLQKCPLKPNYLLSVNYFPGVKREVFTTQSLTPQADVLLDHLQVSEKWHSTACPVPCLVGLTAISLCLCMCTYKAPTASHSKPHHPGTQA